MYGKGCNHNTGTSKCILRIQPPNNTFESNASLLYPTLPKRLKCVDRVRHERQIGVFSHGRKSKKSSILPGSVNSSFSKGQIATFSNSQCSHEGKKPRTPPRNRAGKVIIIRGTDAKFSSSRVTRIVRSGDLFHTIRSLAGPTTKR